MAELRTEFETVNVATAPAVGARDVPATWDRLSAVSSRTRRVFWSPLTGSWTCGLLLCATVLMPLCVVPGCKGSPPSAFYPCGAFENVDGFESLLKLQTLTWSYLFGLVAAVGTLLLAVTGQVRHFRTLWLTYAAAIVLISLGLWLLMGSEMRDDENPDSLEHWLSGLRVLVPTFVLLGALVVTYFSCHTWLSAALWVQLTLSILATAWFLDLLLEFQLDFMWGGKLSLAASLGMIAATAAELRWGARAFGGSGIRPKPR